MYGYWKYKCHVLIFYGSELTIYNSGVILNNRWLSGGGGEVYPRLWLRGPAHTQPVTADLTSPYRPDANQFLLFAYELHY